MEKYKFLQIAIISVILFILISYCIRANQDKIIIDEIIQRKCEDEDDDDIVDMLKMKDEYLAEKFKTSVIRGLVLGISMYFVMCWMYGRGAATAPLMPAVPMATMGPMMPGIPMQQQVATYGGFLNDVW